MFNQFRHKYKSFPNLEHVHPCTIKDETLQDYHRQKSAFPPYMGEFLSVYEDQFPNMSPREMEDRLLDGFYEGFVRVDGDGGLGFEVKVDELGFCVVGEGGGG